MFGTRADRTGASAGGMTIQSLRQPCLSCCAPTRREPVEKSASLGKTGAKKKSLLTTPASYPVESLFMPIEALSSGSLDYLAAFDLRAICVSRGRVYVSHTPREADAAWWAKADDADRIAAAASAGDVPAAAARLGLVATPHCVVVKRVAERVSVIDQEVAAAIDSGTLQRFNQTYRERRLAAKRNGQKFISYSEALRKLRKVIAKSVANGGEIPPSFIVAAFDEAPRIRTRKRDRREVP